MTADLKTEFERRKELTVYALRKDGIADNDYAILFGNTTVDPHDFGVAHLRVISKTEILFYFVERGQRSGIAVFDDMFYAFKHFYWQITDAKSQWAYREEWEASLNE